jgi:AcrR family transcriptional regulator
VTGTPPTARAPRPDTLRRREQIVQRTAHLFAQHGVETPMEEVAAHAGVGVGTLYRHFPDRTSLTQAVAEHLYEQIGELVQQASGEHQGWEALTAVVHEWVNRRLSVRKPLDRWLTEARDADPRLRELNTSIVATLGEILAAAKASGAVRADLSTVDLIRLIGLLVLAEEGTERLTELMLDGLRPPGAAAVQ